MTQSQAFDATLQASPEPTSSRDVQGRGLSKGVTMLAAVNDNAAHGDGVQIFAAGPSRCTACAPTSACKTDVEIEASRGEPRGSILVWRAFAGKMDGGLHPRPCPFDPGRQHWLLVRDLRR